MLAFIPRPAGPPRAMAIGVLAALLAAATSAEREATASPSRDAPVDFVREIRPILSQHCFACHGPDADSRRAGLSLVDLEQASSVLESGARAIVPGDRAGSELWRRITSRDDPMPPRDEHDALTADEIDRLGRWLDQGASYAPHWAYVPPVATPAPEVIETGWPRSDADHYILARLEAEGLAPAPDADDITLVRRLTYDLTGLPPEPADIDAFCADTSSDAVAKVVERLLASPRFGERMAMFWLDLVRYADTVGYHGDQPHRIWPYRDYVINAFNENMPFDRFTIEQLAGDLLPEPTQDQLVATGYNRLLQTSHEGGVQLEEYRAIYQADRIRSVSGVWMGATIGCAQCHDHKFDPYSARDFYALGAFFADIDDEEHLRNQYDGLNTLPTRRTPEMRVTSEPSRRKQAGIGLRITEVERDLDRVIARLPDERAAWERTLLAEVDQGLDREFIWVDDQLDTGGRTEGDWSFVSDGPVPPHSGEAYRVQSGDGLIQHYSVDTTDKTITVREGDTFFAWVHMAEPTPAHAVMLQFNVGVDWQHRAVWGGDQINFGRRPESWDGYRRMGALPQAGEWVRLSVEAAAVGLPPGTVVSGIAFTQYGGTVYWDRAGVRTNQVAPVAVIEALRTPVSDRTDAQRDAIAAHHVETSPTVAELRGRIARLDRERDALESELPLTMYTRALDEPREVRVLPRGNWLDTSGDVVEPAIPEFMGRLQVDDRATRLDLARWLVTPVAQGGIGELTARVFVNRAWAMFYGQGLCPSPEDFGGQGRPPTHPELLDHLAREFVQSGWDVKALVKRMVLTRTYRQSSVPSRETRERDPENLLFARQSRQRLPAEMIRDTVLAVSGLLVNRVGGPSVKPPQPEDHYRHLNFPPRRYEPDMGSRQWRRGVYVHWQRQFLHPMLRAFDAPTREECTPQRTVSNTPVAALALLNDPIVVEASRVYAQGLLSGPRDDDRATIARAMRAATGRRPRPAEIDVLAGLLEESRKHYQANPASAKALLEVGASPRDESLDAVNLAAWIQVTRTIFNLHETITRE